MTSRNTVLNLAFIAALTPFLNACSDGTTKDLDETLTDSTWYYKDKAENLQLQKEALLKEKAIYNAEAKENAKQMGGLDDDKATLEGKLSDVLGENEKLRNALRLVEREAGNERKKYEAADKLAVKYIENYQKKPSKEQEIAETSPLDTMETQHPKDTTIITPK